MDAAMSDRSFISVVVVAAMPGLGPTNPVRRDTRRGPEPTGPQLKREEGVVEREVPLACGSAPYTLLDRDPSAPSPPHVWRPLDRAVGQQFKH